MVRIDVVDEPPTEDACTSQSAEPFCDPPLRAGISIRYRNSSGSACSAGFPARSRSDRRLYLMTAGHCVRNRGLTWVTRFPGGTVHDIGPRHSCVAGRGPANNCRQGPADAALLRVTNPSGWDNARGCVRAGIRGKRRCSWDGAERELSDPANRNEPHRHACVQVRSDLHRLR